jgi:hypothetical protein
MGNPMTPFVPPAAAFDPPVLNILASTAVSGGIIALTNAQALSDVLYISGTATNLIFGPYITFPTNSPAKVYTLVVDAVTFGTTSNIMALAHVSGTVTNFYPSLTWQFAHLPSGISSVYFFRASATNITYP